MPPVPVGSEGRVDLHQPASVDRLRTVPGVLTCPAMQGVFLISAILLSLSGGAKLADPAPTSGALAAAGLPSATVWARLLGGLEVVIAAVALTAGGAVGGAAVAVIYGAFAGFVLVALRRDLPIQSCGCFGKVDTPPSMLHVVADVVAACSGVWVAVTGTGGLAAALEGQPLLGLPYLALLGIGVAALYLILAELPRLTRLTTGTA